VSEAPNIIDLIFGVTKPEPAVAPAPRPALTVVGSGYAAAALERECGAVAQAGEGTRNDTLNKAAFSLGQLVAGGALERGEVEAGLLAAARSAGLTEKESRATIASGLKAGAEHPRGVPEPRQRPQEAHTLVNPRTGEVLPDLPQMPSAADVEAFWAARPALTTIRDMARARRTGPWAVLGCALAHVVTCVPEQVVLPPLVGGHGSLNLFIGLVGHSGQGKGAAEAAATAAIDVGDYDAVPLGSGEGLVHAYVKHTRDGLERVRRACLFKVTEIDTLTATAQRKGATVMPILRSAWSGELLGFQNADVSRRVFVPAHTYRATLIAGIQPARADALLGDSDGGTPQRFVWLPVADPDAPEIKPAEPAPIAWSMPRFSADPFGLSPLTLTPTIAAVVDAERLAALRGSGGGISGHDTLARVKLAAALALLDGRLAVTDDDWHLAGVVHAVNLHTREGVAAVLRNARSERTRAQGAAEAERALVVQQRIEEAALRRVGAWVLRRLEDRGPATAGDLRRALPGRDRQHLDVVLDDLESRHRISQSAGSDGRTRYVREA